MPRRHGFDVFLTSLAFVWSNEIYLASAADKSFFDACARGDTGFLTKEIKENPSSAKAATEDGETCLHLIAISGNVKAAKLIVDAGADIDARTTSTTGLRMHPLSWNIYGGHLEIIEILLQNGVKVNADYDSANGDKVTALDIADTLREGNEKGDRGQLVYDILVANGAKKIADVHKNEP